MGYHFDECWLAALMLVAFLNKHCMAWAAEAIYHRVLVVLTLMQMSKCHLHKCQTSLHKLVTHPSNIPDCCLYLCNFSFPVYVCHDCMDWMKTTFYKCMYVKKLSKDPYWMNSPQRTACLAKCYSKNPISKTPWGAHYHLAMSVSSAGQTRNCWTILVFKSGLDHITFARQWNSLFMEDADDPSQ